MNGIVFFPTRDLGLIRNFYAAMLELPVWLNQDSCIIFKAGNQLLGFCEGESSEICGSITFFFDCREQVDNAYSKLKNIAKNAPRKNPKYNIYHFWATDPEGRSLEFQCFERQLEPYITLEAGLKTRRSIRKYTAEPVADELLNKVFELCRYSPTACNLQGYYYVVIKNREILEKIVALRGPSGKPILAAPYAIAVAAKGDISHRKIQDACIAAYHLLLAAKAYGLGTCWVTDMDREEIKNLLSIPYQDYIACLTPIGYPAEHFPLPDRHQVSDFVRYL